MARPEQTKTGLLFVPWEKQLNPKRRAVRVWREEQSSERGVLENRLGRGSDGKPVKKGIMSGRKSRLQVLMTSGNLFGDGGNLNRAAASFPWAPG